MAMRVVLSVLVLAAVGIVNHFLRSVEPIASASAAGMQFANSDAGYVASMGIMALVKGMTLPFWVAALAILAIWWRPLKRLFASPPVIGALALLLLLPASAWAYFDTTDKTEAYTVLPNESAFWIPDVGANRDAQTNLDSEDYLQHNKIAAKRFIIPHQKLQGTGGNCLFCGWDAYVPTGRLIIVDRTPFSREWVDASDRGTSARKEGFPCQSKEGLNITVGVNVGASVTEENAAKFLYHFGVLPPRTANGAPLNRNDPAVIFTSVYYGRSVHDVMDDFGRKKIEAMMCSEVMARGFDQANADARKIIDDVSKSAVAYFKDLGITIDFLGYADTFSFDKDVQDSVNRRYIAQNDQMVAQLLQPYVAAIQAIATADTLRDFGKHSDGKLPSTIVGLPPAMGDLFGTLLRTGSQPPGAK